MNLIKETLEVNSLRKKILFFVLLGVFLTGLITSLSTSLPFYISASKNLEQITQASLERQAAVLNNQLGKYQDLAQQFTSRTEIKLRLENYAAGKLSFKELQDYSKPRLADAMRLSNNLLGMKRLGPKGEEIVSLGSTPELSDLQVWLERVNRNAITSGYCFTYLNNQIVVAVVANIFNKQQEFIGQDLLFFSTKDIKNTLAEQTGAVSAGSSFLINLTTQDKLELSNNHLTLMQETNPATLANLNLLKRNQLNFNKPTQSEEAVIFFLPLGFERWNLVIHLPAKTFYAQVKQKLIWPLLSLSFMVVLVGYVLSRILQPLTYRLAYQAKELKTSTAELRLAASVFEGTREAIVVTDAEMRLVKLNAAFTQITGYEFHEIAGKNLFSMFFQAKGVEKLLVKIQDSLIKQASWQGEIWYLDKNGKLLPVLQSISAQIDANNQVSHYIHIFNDISESKAFENKINYLAHYDQLTDLANRTLINKRLTKAVALSSRKQQSLAILFMDLDHFKEVNDSLGHAVGDLLLKAVAKRLTSLIRVEDTLGRLGGDEFLLVLSPETNKEDAGLVAEKIINALTQPFLIEEKALTIGVSIGIALCPADTDSADELIRFADRAMYLAKESGRNTYRYYTQTLDAEELEEPKEL